ncbi:hypothetical protein HXX76_015225 [Chlamydomonas incerta]|uniref:Uncharacterized protein n=1 Tax=Chlamydomonas incerta TaxID=51695 RepID=A0A835SF25_CHLIN|nr:hypothetical protein HXX76_015225 [Chlamydomonas incerta]|eukprot:KAG2423587.1 hypothetical protein HXX76_015225 [Chlamydomonas incerta]
MSHCGCTLAPEVLTAAAAAGNAAGCERLLGGGVAAGWRTVTAAAEAGHLPGACAGGQADILAWLQQAHGYQPRPVDAAAAARAGQVAMLEQLLPPPPTPAQLPSQAAAEAGDGDRLRMDHGLLWEPDTAAAAAAAADAAPVQHPLAPRWHAENRLRLLQSIIHGCPVEVLQRHYEPLSRGWVPSRTAEGAAAAQPPAGAAGGGAGDEAAEAATISLDCLQRLQRLRAHGFQFGTRAAELISQGGHADALAYLWDECGVPGPMGAPDPVGDFLRGCNRALARGSKCEAGARLLRVLQLLATRGAALSAEHAAMAADCRMPEPMLLYLAEAAEPVAERGGDLWDQAFSRAAQQGTSLAVLRVLRQRRGAAVDLVAVACGGGSEEALDWAAAELAAEGSALQPLDEREAASVAGAGSTAAMGWLRGRGLLPPPTSGRT